MFNLPVVANRLKDLGIAEFRFLPETGSTNDAALAWVAQGAADFSLVAADSQTRGRGRMNRRWVTMPGSALAFRLILSPSEREASQVGLISGLGAVAVAEALEQGWALQPRIKWPNDVLLDGRKGGGVLAEAVWSGSRLEALVLGIGVNVEPSSVPSPDEMLFPAVSLEEIAGRKIDRWDVLERIMERLISIRTHWGGAQWVEAWNQRLAYRGEVIQITMPGYNISGEVVEVDPAGCLKVRREDGSEETVLAGDVRLRPAGNGR